MKPNMNVAAAIVINDGEILIAQRLKGKQHELYWEFPGGKIECGETTEDCLRREFVEELGLSIEVKEYFKKLEFEYDYAKITLDLFFATSKSKEAKVLTAHEKIAWIKPKQLKEYNLVPADEIIVDDLIEHLQKS